MAVVVMMMVVVMVVVVAMVVVGKPNPCNACWTFLVLIWNPSRMLCALVPLQWDMRL